MWEQAQRIAAAMLTDGVAIPASLTRAVFAWRAEHLGDDAAADDRARAEQGGRAARIYDEEGALRPPEQPPTFPPRPSHAI